MAIFSKHDLQPPTDAINCLHASFCRIYSVLMPLWKSFRKSFWLALYIWLKINKTQTVEQSLNFPIKTNFVQFFSPNSFKIICKKIIWPTITMSSILFWNHSDTSLEYQTKTASLWMYITIIIIPYNVHKLVHMYFIPKIK